MTILYIILFAALWCGIAILGMIIAQIPDWWNGLDIECDASDLILCMLGPVMFFAGIGYAIISILAEKGSLFVIKGRAPKD